MDDDRESKNVFAILIVVATMIGLLISVGISLYQNNLLKGEMIDLQIENEGLLAKVEATLTPTPMLTPMLTPTMTLTQVDTDEVEIKEMLTTYLDAYIAQDWVKVKELLFSKTVDSFDQRIAEGYDIDSYEIVSMEKSVKTDNTYTVMVKLYNRSGELQRLMGKEELEFLVKKEGDVWKTLTWYLFP